MGYSKGRERLYNIIDATRICKGRERLYNIIDARDIGKRLYNIIDATRIWDIVKGGKDYIT